jgi:hypothetical protein
MKRRNSKGSATQVKPGIYVANTSTSVFKTASTSTTKK